MRAAGVLLGLALSLAVPPAAVPLAHADEDTPPSRQQVREAREAADDAARDVASVQADLAAANSRLEESAVAAARATEAWNGARYRLGQARQAAAAAEDRAGIARSDVDRQQEAYAGALVASYEMAPALTAVSSMVQSDGIEAVVEQTTTMQATASALDTRYDGFRAAATLADVAVEQAEAARSEALALQVEARTARDEARAAADAAASEAAAIATRKSELIAELAELEDISVELAEQRQAALEQQALEEAAAAAQEQAQQQTQPATQQPSQQEPQEAQQPSQPAPPAPQPPASPPAPEPPAPASPPAPGGGVAAAVAFARAQIGEPYRWGAAGPDSWDCSGLTMGAWRAGGKALPHYSVAQYEQSTPISAGQLQAGDLVFWGSSGSPSSIYHVALYVGGGQIVHAPRTGRPVTQESMYYWTSPNFFARP
ncbi:C40 family peptidase [Nocardioides coralli]|uniref:C40 family peptidase n=1 Tax=Nocardioides coralli TaxID=2872154 RepID=UPI001CA44508|nr:C40 family peptidase [Nocardioides coralli]QZY29399.1 C40 family peptidase [Nocardioides coralli]